MLEVRHLTVNYRGVQALEDIGVVLKPGELTGLIGPNGAGKSTLMKAILGLVPLQRGQVCWCGQPLRQHRHRVAYVPQRSQIDFDYPITAWGVVRLGVGRRWLGWNWALDAAARAQAQQALQRVGLWELRHRQIGELSGGQQQRVFLARALAQDADVLLLDEPFAGVDRVTEAAILVILADLKAAGKTLLVCSHEWGEQLDRYDRLLLLNRSLIANGVPSQVMTLENIQRAYGNNLRLQAPESLPLAC
jgi:manganese/iron transport system ATP-binding protein